MRDTILVPRVRSQEGGDKIIRLWSAACSSGENPIPWPS
ncbi:MAG: hypothetical protein JRL30_22195 [Deltaproteobacteria bacterium]|nr:hypothetical protein [Deltaproteobacteria bacterium]